MENFQKPMSQTESKSVDAHNLKGKAIEVAEEIKTQGKDRLESGKKIAAEGVEELAGALEQATESLGGDKQSLTSYAQELATSVRSLATNLRDRSIDDLFGDTQALARRNPTLFFVGSVAVGVALSRFMKASAERGSSRFPDNIMPSGVARSGSDVERPRESSANVQAGNWPESSACQTVSPEFADDTTKKGV